MFTGIIEELGTVAAMTSRAAGARIAVRCSTVLSDAAEGVEHRGERRVSDRGGHPVGFVFGGPGAGDAAADQSGRPLGGVAVNLERPLSPSGR